MFFKSGIRLQLINLTLGFRTQCFRVALDVNPQSKIMKNLLASKHARDANAMNLSEAGLNAIFRRLVKSFFLALLVLLPAVHSRAIAAENIVFAPGPDSFRIADSSGATPMLFAPGDADVVRITAGLFAEDVDRVTGQKPSLLTAPPTSGKVILVGTLDGNPWIQQLAGQGKLATNDFAGQWETSRRFIVQNPFPGVSIALVIAGSDRRGAAYGLIELSEEMGVSPWVWWADVPPTKHAARY